MNRRISLRTAAVTGLLFAMIMCAWKYASDGIGFDQLAIRFAIYFSVFTLGFWWFYNYFTARRGR